MLYDYDEDEQSRNDAKNPKGYSPHAETERHGLRPPPPGRG